MKKYIFLICLSPVFFKAYSQAEKTPLYYDYIKINENSKKIKDAKIRRMISVFFGRDREDTVNISYYDVNGLVTDEYNLITVKTASETKKIYQKYFYKYDINGRVLEKIDSTGPDSRRILLIYEENGDMDKEEVYSANAELLKKISYEYDNLGRLIESDEKDIAGSCKSKKEYAYDSYNNIVKYKLSSNCLDSAYKAVDITYIYKYDNKSNILEKNSLFSEKSFKTESFTYGTNGKVEQSYTLIGNEQYTLNLYFYDKMNMLEKNERTEVNAEEKRKFIKTFKYDKFGNLEEVMERNELGTLIFTIKYNYDFY